MGTSGGVPLAAQDIDPIVDIPSVTDEIIVRASPRRSAVDRRSYDVDASGATVTARDAIERVPGVVVEIDGQISVLGQTNIAYMVDGQYFPTELALQIPASQIARVEIITNPGAESQGDGVVINLILREEVSAPRSVTATLRADTRDRMRARVDYSREDAKWSQLAYLSAERNERRQEETADFLYLSRGQAGDTGRRRVAFDRGEIKGSGLALLTRKLGGGRALSVGLNASANGIDIRNSRAFARTRSGTTLVDRREDSRTRMDVATYGVTTSYVVDEADGPKRSFNLNAGGYAVDTMQRDRFAADRAQVATGAFLRDTDQDAAYAILSAMREGKDEEGRELKAGLDARWFDVTERYAAATGGAFSPDGSFARRTVQADAYLSYAFTAGGFSVLPGLRAEWLETDVVTEEAEETDGPSYARLLPSLHLARRIGDLGTIKASGTVKSLAPTYTAFDPVRRRTAFDTFQQGDADLGVGIARNLEASHELSWDGKTLLTTLYRRERDDRSDLFTDFLGEDRFLLRYVNVDDIRVGANVNLTHRIGARFEQVIDASVFRVTQEWRVDGRAFAADQASYTVKYNAEFRRSERDQVLLIVQQQGPGLDLNLDSSPRLSSTVRWVRSFEGGPVLTVEGIDLLATDTRTTRFESDDFVRSSAIQRQERGLRLTLTQRF